VGRDFSLGAKFLFYLFKSSYISIHKPIFESVFGMSVLLVMQVISYKINVTNYMCNFPVWISTENCWLQSKFICHRGLLGGTNTLPELGGGTTPVRTTTTYSEYV